MKALFSLEPNPIIICAKFTGHKFKKIHWYRKNKLYFQIECNYSSYKDYCYYTLLKSHPSKDLDFYPFQLLYSKIQSLIDDPKIPLRIRFYDYAGDQTEGKIVGQCYTDLESLKNSVGKIIPITKIREDGEEFDVGSIMVNSFRISQLIPFTEYVKCGFKFNLAVAIDMFFINELYPTLHKENEPNNFEQVLSLALEILMPYIDGDSIASYGLGYGYKTKFRICGNLALDDSKLILYGMDEVITTYKRLIKKISFNGYCWFSPLIEKTTKLA